MIEPLLKKTEAEVVPLLWKPPQAAKALNMGARKLWSLTAAKLIPHVRVGRLVRYVPDDLRAWIESQKIPARAG